MRKSPRKSLRNGPLRKQTRFALLACLIQSGILIQSGLSVQCAWAQQGNYTTVAPKITDSAERTTAQREKAAEVKSGSGGLSATTKFYRDYAIPTITLVQPSKISELNWIRRNFEEDIDQLARASKAFRASYNKAVLPELEKVIKDTNTHPSARAICFGMAMQLSIEPASGAPALPSKSLLPIIGAALRPDESVDANQLLALDAVERFLLTKSTQPDEILSDRNKSQLCKLISALLTLDGPAQRQQKSHHYMLERALRTLTTMAVTGQANAATAKEASTTEAATAVAGFVKVALADSRSSEWLKEACCMSLGSVTFPQDAFTPEEALQLQQDVAKFSIRSLKDWMNKVARSGGGGGGSYGGSLGYGSSTMMSESSSYPTSGSEDMGLYGGMPGGGIGGGNQSSANRQPVEVKNARRMLNQRLERIHLAFYGLPTGDGKPVQDNPAKRGIASFAPASEKYKLDHTIEKLREVQTSLNSDRINALATLTSMTNPTIRDFGAACFEISGDIARAIEDEADLNLTFFGAPAQPAPDANGQPPANGAQGAPGNGAVPPGAGQVPGAGQAPGPGPGGPNRGNPAPAGAAPGLPPGGGVPGGGVPGGQGPVGQAPVGQAPVSQ